MTRRRYDADLGGVGRVMRGDLSHAPEGRTPRHEHTPPEPPGSGRTWLRIVLLVLFGYVVLLIASYCSGEAL